MRLLPSISLVQIRAGAAIRPCQLTGFMIHPVCQQRRTSRSAPAFRLRGKLRTEIRVPSPAQASIPFSKSEVLPGICHVRHEDHDQAGERPFALRHRPRVFHSFPERVDGGGQRLAGSGTAEQSFCYHCVRQHLAMPLPGCLMTVGRSSNLLPTDAGRGSTGNNRLETIDALLRAHCGT